MDRIKIRKITDLKWKGAKNHRILYLDYFMMWILYIVCRKKVELN